MLQCIVSDRVAAGQCSGADGDNRRQYEGCAILSPTVSMALGDNLSRLSIGGGAKRDQKGMDRTHPRDDRPTERPSVCSQQRWFKGTNWEKVKEANARVCFKKFEARKLKKSCRLFLPSPKLPRLRLRLHLVVLEEKDTFHWLRLDAAAAEIRVVG